jgi:hypothetical protein
MQEILTGYLHKKKQILEQNKLAEGYYSNLALFREFKETVSFIILLGAICGFFVTICKFANLLTLKKACLPTSDNMTNI